MGELTLEEIQNAEYQTKDLGETFVGYFYLKKYKNVYRLYKHDIEYTWVEGDRRGKSIMDRLGHMEEKSSQELLINDIGTNTINVYNYFPKENYDYWVEFSLIFIDNKLNKIEVKEFREEKNDERKVRDLELRELMRKSVEFNNSFRGKVISFVRNVYHKTIWRCQYFIGDLLIKVGNALKYWHII